MGIKVTKGFKVRVAVELNTLDGKPIEATGVEYVHGGGTMLRGLEAALEGMEAGQSKEGTLKAKDAFGTEEQLPTKKLPRGEFPKGEKLDVGRVFEARDPKGAPISFKI